MRALVLGAVLVACLRPAPPRNPASADACDQVLDHMIDLAFRESLTWSLGDGYAESRHENRSAVREERGDRFIRVCRRELSHAVVECALVADNHAAAIACDRRFDLSAPR